MKTTKHSDNWLNGTQYLWAGLAVLFILISVFSFAQTRTTDPVRVKIIKIVDGDTVTIEKSMEESNVEDFTKQFQNIKGKNVQVMVTVDADEKDGKIKSKNKSASSMHFNFDMDSAMANAFSKCMVFSDSAKCKKFVWNDSLLKGLPKDFNFNFSEGVLSDNFDDEEIMKDFDFNFNIDTKENGKTVIIKKNGGNTIVINGDDEDVTIDKSDSENGKTKTTTKTIVINDDKTTTKKKVIVSTSVVIMDMDDEKATKRKAGQQTEENMENFSLYPNPSDGNFILDLDLNGKDDALIRITDMNGKEVYNEKIKGNGKTRKTVNLGNEKKGTFIVTIKQGKRTSSKKIIIE